MKVRWLLSAVVAVPVLIAPLSAEEQKSEEKEQQSGKDAPKEKMICRSNQATGSRLHRNKVCMTKSQWRKHDAQIQKDLNDYSRNASRNTPSTSGPLGGT